MNRSSALYIMPFVAALGFAAPASAQVSRPGAFPQVASSSQSGDITQVQWGYGHPGYGYGHRGYGYGHRGYGWGHRGYYAPRAYGWGHRGYYGRHAYGWGPRRYW